MNSPQKRVLTYRVAEIPNRAKDQRRAVGAASEIIRQFLHGLLELERLPGGFRAYSRSFASYAELERDLRARFAFMGELSAY